MPHLHWTRGICRVAFEPNRNSYATRLANRSWTTRKCTHVPTLAGRTATAGGRAIAPRTPVCGPRFR